MRKVAFHHTREGSLQQRLLNATRQDGVDAYKSNSSAQQEGSMALPLRYLQGCQAQGLGGQHCQHYHP